MAEHSLYWGFIQEYACTEYAVISCIMSLLLLYSFALFVRNLQISSKVSISVQKVLIITAHPDDECMFFSPTIQSLLNSGHFVHVLCLSNGKWYINCIISLKVDWTRDINNYCIIIIVIYVSDWTWVPGRIIELCNNGLLAFILFNPMGWTHNVSSYK